MSTPRYGELFDKSWNAIRGNLGLVAALTFVFCLATVTVSMAPFVGTWLAAFLQPGYLVCLLKIKNKEEIGYKDFFWTFLEMNRLLQNALLHLLTIVMVAVGLIFLVIPGIYIAVGISLASTYFVLRKQDAVESLRFSMRLVSQHWWFVFGLLFLIGILNLLGAICLLLGLLVTIPMAILLLVFAMESLEAIAKPEDQVRPI